MEVSSVPKKKRGSSTSKILIVVILMAVVSIGVVGWHDGMRLPWAISMMVPSLKEQPSQ